MGYFVDKNLKNNSGTTLAELMVYMVVGLIVITSVFKVITDGASSYVHARAVSKAQFTAREAISVMSRDIASMGYKMYIDTIPDTVIIRIDSLFGATIDKNIVGNTYYTNEGNKAAFFFRDGGSNSDTLEFFRIRVNEEGRRIARERIVYSFDEDNKQIIREFFDWDDATPPGNWKIENSTIIASNVAALNFRFSRSGDNNDANWISAFVPTAGATITRDEIQHIEIAILVRSHREGNAQSLESYLVGDREYTVDAADKKFIYRLYRQAIEVPNNATGF
jgi:hypothetical protein